LRLRVSSSVLGRAGLDLTAAVAAPHDQAAPAAAALPSVIGGPGSDSTYSPTRRKKSWTPHSGGPTKRFTRPRGAAATAWWPSWRSA